MQLKTIRLASIIFIVIISLLLISCKTQSIAPPTPHPPQKMVFEVMYQVGGLEFLYNPKDSPNRALFFGFYINEHGEVYSFSHDDFESVQEKTGNLYSHNEIYRRYGNDVSIHGIVSEDQLKILQNAALNINPAEFVNGLIGTDSGRLIYKIYFATEKNEFLYKLVKVYEACDNFYLNTSPETFDIMSTLEMVILEYELDSVLRPFCGYETTHDIAFDESIFEQMLNFK